MKIMFKNIPSGTCWTSDLLLSLITRVQNVAGVLPRIDKENPKKDGDTVYTIVTEIPEKLTDNNLRSLAKVILWFLWCHGFNNGTYVVFQTGLLEKRIYLNDFPELMSIFFPSRK